jgi:hypothetical protein
MEGVERAHRVGKRSERPREDLGHHLDEGQTREQLTGGVAVGPRVVPRVEPYPELVLEKPTGDEVLRPEILRRTPVFRQELRQRDGRVDVDQRSFRSSDSSASRS